VFKILIIAKCPPVISMVRKYSFISAAISLLTLNDSNFKKSKKDLELIILLGLTFLFGS